MPTFKQVLIKICKEETVKLGSMRIYLYFCIFILNLTNMFLCLFLDKKDIMCLMIAFA